MDEQPNPTPTNPISQPSTPEANDVSLSTETPAPTISNLAGATAPDVPQTSAGLESPSPAPMPTADGQFQPPMQSKKSGKKGKVILIVIIAVILAAAAVYFYTKGNKSSQTNNPVATTPAPTKVTASDVNQTISSVDASIKKADSANDVSSNDLSNGTLGL